MTGETARKREALSTKPATNRLQEPPFTDSGFNRDRAKESDRNDTESADIESRNIGPQEIGSDDTRPQYIESRTAAQSLTNDPHADARKVKPPPQGDGFRVVQQDQVEPLRECVRNALRHYLHNMDGHDINDLYRMVLDEVERPLIETVMESTNNNQSIAARMLGLSRGTLRKKLRNFDPN